MCAQGERGRGREEGGGGAGAGEWGETPAVLFGRPSAAAAHVKLLEQFLGILLLVLPLSLAYSPTLLILFPMFPIFHLFSLLSSRHLAATAVVVLVAI